MKCTRENSRRGRDGQSQLLSMADHGKIQPIHGSLSAGYARRYNQDGLVQGNHIPPVCARCGKENETVGHILTRYERNQFSLIKKRHEVVRGITRALFRNTQTRVTKKLRQGIVFRLADSTTLILDQSILTIENVREKKPYLVFVKERQIQILEMTVVW